MYFRSPEKGAMIWTKKFVWWPSLVQIQMEGEKEMAILQRSNLLTF